jgi:hypothetical protein
MRKFEWRSSEQELEAPENPTTIIIYLHLNKENRVWHTQIVW